MVNDDRMSPLPRLSIALARRGLPPREAWSFTELASALADELPARALPLALIRLRRHLGRRERAERRP